MLGSIPSGQASNIQQHKPRAALIIERWSSAFQATGQKGRRFEAQSERMCTQHVDLPKARRVANFGKDTAARKGIRLHFIFLIHHECHPRSALLRGELSLLAEKTSVLLLSWSSIVFRCYCRSFDTVDRLILSHRHKRTIALIPGCLRPSLEALSLVSHAIVEATKQQQARPRHSF